MSRQTHCPSSFNLTVYMTFGCLITLASEMCSFLVLFNTPPPLSKPCYGKVVIKCPHSRNKTSHLMTQWEQNNIMASLNTKYGIMMHIQAGHNELKLISLQSYLFLYLRLRACMLLQMREVEFTHLWLDQNMWTFFILTLTNVLFFSSLCGRNFLRHLEE